MQKIYVLGMGPGTKEFISPYVISCIKSADVIIGGKRHFEEIQEEVKNKEQYFITSKLLELITFIKSNRDKKIAVLVSGDPGFYSLLVFLKKYFSTDELLVVPGLSSLQYMFSKVGFPWQDAILKSLHGKKFDYVKSLEKHNLIGLLTDSINTPQHIAQTLVDNGFGDVEIYVGESLSYEDEKITKMSAFELAKVTRGFSMNVVILNKEKNVSY